MQASAIKDMVLGTCLSILIFAVSYTVPLLGAFVLLLLPLPVLYFRLKLGRHSGLIIALASFLVLVIITRSVASDTLYFGALIMTGLFLGECIEQHCGIEKTMIVTVSGVVALSLAAFGAYAAFQGQGIKEILQAFVSHYLALTSGIYSDMGAEQEMIDNVNEIFLFVLPGMFIVSYISTVWINVLLIKKLLARIGIQLKNLAALNRFRAPDPLVWAVIGSVVLLALPAGPVRYVVINGLIVLMLIYFFQGIAVISFYFQKKGSPTFLKVFCYGLIAAQSYLLIVVIGLGFFDNWINFRKLETQKK